MAKLSELELVWRDGNAPSTEIIAQVRQDIAEVLDPMLDNPVNLAFHCVWLTDDWENGPYVLVNGFEDRDDALDAGYYL